LVKDDEFEISESLFLEPVSEDDWDLLTLHAGFLEQQFLSQIRVVSLKQEISFWTKDNALVKLKICRHFYNLIHHHIFNRLSASTLPTIHSNSPIILLQNTELVIQPKIRVSKVLEPETNSSFDFKSYLRVIFSMFDSGDKLTAIVNATTLASISRQFDLTTPCENIYMLSACKFKHNTSVKTDNDKAEPTRQFKTAVWLCVDESIPNGYIGLTKIIANILEAEIFSRVRFETN
ncbi:Peroxisome biosynthesis protein pex1, partial [Nowakowskiella sp. JEL0078]